MSRKKRKKKKAGSLEDVPVNDPEVELWQAVERRLKRPGDMPDIPALLAMEQPVDRLMGAASLFRDLATAVSESPLHGCDHIRLIGLAFLSQAMRREAERVYALYHGARPDYG